MKESIKNSNEKIKSINIFDNSSLEEKENFLISIFQKDAHLNKDIPGVEKVRNNLIIEVKEFFRKVKDGKIEINYDSVYVLAQKINKIILEHRDFYEDKSHFGLSIEEKSIKILGNFFENTFN